MLPYILAAVGGYLIGQSRKDEQFADGGIVEEIKEFEKSLKPMRFQRLTRADKIRAIFKHFLAKGYSKQEINTALVEMKYADGGKVSIAGTSYYNLYHHKTSGGAEYLCSKKVKGTKDEGDLKSDICVRIDGAKTHGGELKIGDEKIKLYYHKTLGLAEYLCSEKVKGTKDEGSLLSKYVVQIDGAKKHGGELMIKEMMAKGGVAGKYKIIQDTDGTIEQGFYVVVDESNDTLLDIFQFKKEAEGYLKEIKEKGYNNVDSSKYNSQKDNYSYQFKYYRE